MKNFKDVYSELRRKNIHQYLLLLCSTAFSVLLITAYLIMMSSKTVLTILPEGGDSRKQVMMIFVLTVIGCVVFINYAIGLFLRYKSRETGIFMALGSAKSQIRSELFKDVGSMMVIACIIGLALATPLAFFIWQIFKIFVVNTEEMVLTISANAFIFSGIFSLVVIGLTFYRLQRFINRANIIDILNEARKSEPIKDVPRWYGAVGILLMILGGVLGYAVPGFIIKNLQYYPPEFLTAFLYLPALVGLYMIMLHTVVNGWRAGT
ncbi:MAG: ABC transporter permease, partial [Tissierellia bacterium]|nr:ABC transporter permease [Tissierellia bacterium]